MSNIAFDDDDESLLYCMFIRYHPIVYKTKLCRSWMTDNCKRVYCPFAHGDAQLRTRGVTKYFTDTSCNHYPDLHSLSPHWGALDEPISQSSYSSTAASTHSNHHFYKHINGARHSGDHTDVDSYLHDALAPEGMQPLGGLVLGSDGHLYLRVIPTRS